MSDEKNPFAGLNDALVRMRAAAIACGQAMQAMKPFLRAASVQGLEERAAAGDPFARQALAEAGHPRWAKRRNRA